MSPQAATATIADVTEAAAKIFAAKRRTIKSTNVILTTQEAQGLRELCILAGIKQVKSGTALALRHYDETDKPNSNGLFAYSFPCLTKGYCFLLTDGVARGGGAGVGGCLYGTCYSGQADIAPLND